MSIESGTWQDHRDQSLSAEIKMYEAVRCEKHAQQISLVFNKLLEMATNTRGLTPITGDVDDYDLSTVLQPGRFMQGYIRAALFEKSLWLRATTAGPLTNSLHNLTLYTDGRPHHYQAAEFHDGAKHGVADIDMVGVDQIATVKHIEYHLGGIVAAFGTEQPRHKQRELSLGDLAVARTAREKQRQCHD